MSVLELAWKEISHRRASLVSGLVAITLGIAVIVGIRSVAVASQHAVAVKMDSLGANVLVLPQGATLSDYHAADIDAPTIPEEYVERIATSGLLGVETTFCSPADVAAALRDDTALVVLETPANPTLELVDIRRVVAASGDVPVLVDNTFATPVLQHPLDLGAAVPLDMLAYKFDIVLRGRQQTLFENKLQGN